MSIRKVNFIQNEYYHVYNRGNSKQKIFNDESDYKHFIYLLYLSNTNRKVTMRDIIKDYFSFDQEKKIIALGAYCLMPNHFHFLITEKDKDGVTKYMQKISTAYAMYYNKKYKRTGSLFEGKFKAEHLDNDRYLKYLFSYIHLNPVKLIQKDWKEKGVQDKQKILDFLKSYKYSSYLDYLGEKRMQNKILDVNSFPMYFHSIKSFNKEIFEWLNYKKE